MRHSAGCRWRSSRPTISAAARRSIICEPSTAVSATGSRRQGLTGAAVWYDYETTEADRLTLAWALAAAEHGAVLANHVEATAPLADGPRVTGVRARDRESGRDLEIGATVTVNATGAAADRLLAPLKISTGIPRLKAMNLVTRREAGEEA